MNVIRPHVRRPENPAVVQTDLAQSSEYGCPAMAVEAIGQLVHLLAFQGDACLTGFR